MPCQRLGIQSQELRLPGWAGFAMGPGHREGGPGAPGGGPGGPEAGGGELRSSPAVPPGCCRKGQPRCGRSGSRAPKHTRSHGGWGRPPPGVAAGVLPVPGIVGAFPLPSAGSRPCGDAEQIPGPSDGKSRARLRVPNSLQAWKRCSPLPRHPSPPQREHERAPAPRARGWRLGRGSSARFGRVAFVRAALGACESDVRS